MAWRGLQPAQIAAGFLTASTRQERLRWVRKPAAVADVMDRYYRDGPGAFEKIADIQKMPLPAAEGSVLERFVVTMTDGSSRLLCVPVDESGGGVDFKSYARHCSAPWSALLDGTVAKAAEMRVLLKPDNYYNFEFADESRWQYLIGSSPDLDNPIYLYARRDSAAMQEITKCRFTMPLPFTIVMEKQGESYKRQQWQLSQVICQGWVEP